MVPVAVDCHPADTVLQAPTMEMTVDHWLQRVREDFPYRDGWIYLQSAGTGLAFPGAAAAAGQYYVDVARLGCDAQALWRVPADSARDHLSRLMGVPTEEVGFFRNTSEVVNLAAHSIDWRPGDEIVVMADEYPCNVLPWAAAERAGATVVSLEPGDAAGRQQQLLDALTPRTRVLSVSHVHPWTGTKLDLTALGQACREVEALFVVDGIQALGATPVDLSYVDVYGAGVFKWLMSGFGTAVGVFRERARSLMSPVFRSYGNPEPSDSFEYAAPNFPGLYVLSAALEYLDELGWDRVFQQVDELAGRAHARLERIGVTPVTPAGARAGIVAIDVDDSTRVADELARRRISVSNRAGRVLVSPHFYNTTEDVDGYVEALNDVLVGSRA